ARAARRGVEESAARQSEHLERLEREERNVQRRDRAAAPATNGARATPHEAPQPGDPVEVGTLGGKLGRLLEVRGKEAVVAVGVRLGLGNEGGSGVTVVDLE